MANGVIQNPNIFVVEAQYGGITTGGTIQFPEGIMSCKLIVINFRRYGHMATFIGSPFDMQNSMNGCIAVGVQNRNEIFSLSNTGLFTMIEDNLGTPTIHIYGIK